MLPVDEPPVDSSSPVGFPPVDLPLRCFDASAMIASVWVASAPLQTRTPDGLQVAEIWPGHTLLGIACLDYRDTSIGPYGEVGIAWPVTETSARRRWALPVLPLLGSFWGIGGGWWVEHLPVTTEPALEAGKVIWGYPKTLADIRFETRGPLRTCEWKQEGRDVLRFSLDTHMPRVPQLFSQRTYTRHQERLHRTSMSVRASGFGRLRSSRAEIVVGTDAVGQALTALGVSTGIPWASFWYPRWQTTLPGPERVT